MEAFIILGAIGLVLGLGLAIASEKFYVEEDLRLEKINQLLPGVNCGACGYPGCGGFAEGIISGEVKALSNCKPGSKGTGLEEIKKYLAETPGPEGDIIKVNL
ncbi:electron transporter RnfB [Mycoplasmatota bacterium]|nr:electron transporter RnfB [Mycoplasmatota bacterium]